MLGAAAGGFVGVLAGSATLGTAVAAASVGSLWAANLVGGPALPDGNDRPAATDAPAVETTITVETTTTVGEPLGPLPTTVDLLSARNGPPGSETAQTTEESTWSGSSASEEDRILWLIVGALVAVAALVALVTWRYWLLTHPDLGPGKTSETTFRNRSARHARSPMPGLGPPDHHPGHTVFDDPHATQPYTPPDVFAETAAPERLPPLPTKASTPASSSPRPPLSFGPSGLAPPPSQPPQGQRIDAALPRRGGWDQPRHAGWHSQDRRGGAEGRQGRGRRDPF